jgi:hypothetical protein
VKITFVWSTKDRVTLVRANAMAQKSTRAVGVPTTVDHNTGDFIEKMPGYRAPVVALVWTAVGLVADARDRTSSARPPFPVTCFGIIWTVGAVEVNQRTLRYPRKLARAGFAGKFRGFPSDHRMNRSVYFQSKNACRELQVRHEELCEPALRLF